MKTIYKYQLEITDLQTLEMPMGSTILSVKEQNYKLTLWALVDTEERVRLKNIQIIGTGNPITNNINPNDWSFIDTVIASNGLVWHIFADKH